MRERKRKVENLNRFSLHFAMVFPLNEAQPIGVGEFAIQSRMYTNTIQ